MPRVRAVAMRSFHNSRGGTCAAVLASTSRRIRSGACMASHIPVMPPIEMPHQSARSMPRWSISAITSRPSMSME